MDPSIDAMADYSIPGIRADKRLHFLLQLSWTARQSLLQKIRCSTAQYASFLLANADHKLKQRAHRNQRNSREHMKGLDAEKVRLGCGKNGFHLRQHISEFYDSEEATEVGIELQLPCTPRVSTVDDSRKLMPQHKAPLGSHEARFQPSSSQGRSAGGKNIPSTITGRQALERKKKACAERSRERRRMNRCGYYDAPARPQQMPVAQILKLPVERMVILLPPAPEVMSIDTQLTCGPFIGQTVNATSGGRPDGGRGMNLGTVRNTSSQSISISLPDGSIMMQNVEFFPEEPVSNLKARIAETLGWSYCLILSSGEVIELRAEAHDSISLEESCIRDQDVLTAIAPMCARVANNQLSLCERLQRDIEFLKVTLEDGPRFECIARRQFKRVCKNKQSSDTPCTDLLRVVCRRIGLQMHCNSTVLEKIQETTGRHDTTLCESEFVKFLSCEMLSFLAELEKHLSDVEGIATNPNRYCGGRVDAKRQLLPLMNARGRGTVEEYWMREYLQGSEYVVVTTRDGERFRLWRSDASCQAFSTCRRNALNGSPESWLFLADGFFEICGDCLVFDWKRSGSCKIGLVTSSLEEDQFKRVQTYHYRRSGPWGDYGAVTANGAVGVNHGAWSGRPTELKILGVDKVKTEDYCKYPGEREEVATGLHALHFLHCEAGGF